MDTLVSSAVLQSRLKSFSNIAAIIAGGTGSIVLIGWFLAIPLLKTVMPGLASMKANTALCVVFCAVALWLRNGNGQSSWNAESAEFLATCLALLAVCIGLATLSEYVFQWNLGIDQFLFADATPDGHSLPGRMAPHTAIGFVTLGTALLLSRIEVRRGARPAQFVLLIPSVISLMAILGYLFSVASFYRVESFTGMALHTAAMIFLLSVAALVSPPGRGLAGILYSDSLGGILVRRLLPVSFLAPIMVGWLRMEGQKAAWYGTEMGLALMVTLNIVIFPFVIYRSGIVISRIAAEQKETERAMRASRDGLRRLNYAFESVVDACPLAIITVDAQARVQVWNRAAEQLLGWTPIEVRGRQISLAVEERAGEFEWMVERLCSGHSANGVETVLLSRDDVRIPVMLWAAPLALGACRTTGGVIVLDRSDHRKRPELGGWHAEEQRKPH